MRGAAHRTFDDQRFSALGGQIQHESSPRGMAGGHQVELGRSQARAFIEAHADDWQYREECPGQTFSSAGLPSTPLHRHLDAALGGHLGSPVVAGVSPTGGSSNIRIVRP
jgi:hypothetical protein